jgi:hypothetical protein
MSDSEYCHYHRCGLCPNKRNFGSIYCEDCVIGLHAQSANTKPAMREELD